MELLELLRQRSQALNQSVQVDCGTLGMLTAQALSLRECRALSAGADGDRAVLYAACRELQSAGELLRREGRVFRPDEIMQLVTDEEAAAGARAVRTLSGMDSSPNPMGDTQNESPTKHVETKSPQDQTLRNSLNPLAQDTGLTTVVEQDELFKSCSAPSHSFDCGQAQSVSEPETERKTTGATEETKRSVFPGEKGAVYEWQNPPPCPTGKRQTISEVISGETDSSFHAVGGENSCRPAADKTEMAENPDCSNGTLTAQVGPVETVIPDQDNVFSLCKAVEPTRRGTRAGSDQAVQEDAERSGEAPAVCPVPSLVDWTEADPGGKPDFTEADRRPTGDQARRRITAGRELSVEQRQADNPQQLEPQQAPPSPTVTAEFAERLARALLEGLRRAAGAR